MLLFVGKVWWLVTSNLLSVTLMLKAKYFSDNPRSKLLRATFILLIMTCYA